MSHKVVLKLDVDSISNVTNVDRNEKGSTIIETADNAKIEVFENGNFHINIQN